MALGWGGVGGVWWGGVGCGGAPWGGGGGGGGGGGWDKFSWRMFWRCDHKSYNWRNSLLDGSYVLRSAATATTNGIHKVVVAEWPDLLRHLRTLLVVTPHGVGQPGVGVAEHVAVGALAEVGHVLVHVGGTQGTVESHGKGLGVTDAVPECLVGLTTQGATYTPPLLTKRV